MRRNIPPPPPRPLSQRLYNLDSRNGHHPQHRRTDSDDENTEMSDNDSILAMAKRLDASSVISDPSFIEGTEPHKGGLDPTGFGESASTLGHGHPAERNSYDSAYNPPERNPYYRGYNARDLDSIASNDREDDSVYTDGSDTQYTEESMERNPHRYPSGHNPPPGVPRVGHHDGSNYGPRVGHYGGNNYGYQGGGYNNHARMDSAARSRSRERGRSHSPSNAMNRMNSRSRSPGMRSKSPLRDASPHSPRRNSSHVNHSRHSREHRDTNDVVDDIITERNGEGDTKRTVKLIAVPVIVVIVIAAAIGIVFATRGGNDKNASQNQELIKVDLPTPSPTFLGEYNCPVGYTGPSPTRGCLGYVQCDGRGEIEGGVMSCPEGTLYDVDLKTCGWAESVKCSTAALPGSDGDTDSTTAATSLATSEPVSPDDTATGVETGEFESGTQVGPIDTANHKLSFQGIDTIGDAAEFEKNMENYINIFFSPSRATVLGEDIAALAQEDPVLNSLSGVNVNLKINKFEWSGVTRLRNLQQNLQLTVIYDQTTEYSTTDQSIKVGTVVRHPYEEQYEPALIEYLKTTDDVFAALTSIDFLEAGQNGGQTSNETTAPVMSSSETSSPVTSAPLTSGETSAPVMSTVETSQPIASLTTAQPSHEPTPMPSAIIIAETETLIPVETYAPTNVAATTSPTVKPTPTQSPTSGFLAFQEYVTIKGYMWIDSNGDGLYQTSEPPATATYANLRSCEDDKWVSTTSSNGAGQYQFVGIEEGEYYVEFFKPSNKYEFTLPMMGQDESALDSDVALLSGRSPCLVVDSSFTQLTNAGYVAVDSSAETDETAATTSTALTETTDIFKYCAQVTTTNGNQSFDFLGCATRCAQASDCDDGLQCVLSKTCSQET